MKRKLLDTEDLHNRFSNEYTQDSLKVAWLLDQIANKCRTEEKKLCEGASSQPQFVNILLAALEKCKNPLVVERILLVFRYSSLRAELGPKLENVVTAWDGRRNNLATLEHCFFLLSRLCVRSKDPRMHFKTQFFEACCKIVQGHWVDSNGLNEDDTAALVGDFCVKSLAGLLCYQHIIELDSAVLLTVEFRGYIVVMTKKIVTPKSSSVTLMNRLGMCYLCLLNLVERFPEVLLTTTSLEDEWTELKTCCVTILKTQNVLVDFCKQSALIVNTLCRLIMSSEHCRLVSGSVDVFLKCLQTLCLCDVVVAERVAAVLAQHCRSYTNVHRFTKSTAAADVVAVLKKHGALSEEVSLHSLDALASLCQYLPILNAVAKTDAASTVSNILRKFGCRNIELAKQGLSCIQRLGRREETITQFASCEAEWIVLDLLFYHGEADADFAMLGFAAMATLCCDALCNKRAMSWKQPDVSSVNLAVPTLSRVSTTDPAGSSPGMKHFSIYRDDLLALFLKLFHLHVEKNAMNDVAKEFSWAVLNLAWDNAENASAFRKNDVQGLIERHVCNNARISDKSAKSKGVEAIRKLFNPCQDDST